MAPGLKTGSYLAVVLAVLAGFYRAKVPGTFFMRIARNAFLPGVPEPIPTLFPPTDDALLVKVKNTGLQKNNTIS